MAMSAGTSSSLLVLCISLSSSSSLRSPLYSPSGSLGCRRVARHCAVSLLRENATLSFSSPNRVARHRTVSSSSNAYAAPGILLGRHRPVAWCAESFRPTRLTREFVTGDGSRLTIATALDHNLPSISFPTFFAKCFVIIVKRECYREF